MIEIKVDKQNVYIKLQGNQRRISRESINALIGIARVVSQIEDCSLENAIKSSSIAALVIAHNMGKCNLMDITIPDIDTIIRGEAEE